MAKQLSTTLAGDRWRWRVGTIAATAALATPLLGLGVSASAAPASAHTAALPEFDSPSGLAMAGGDLWVANKADSSVTEIDPTSGAVVASLVGGSYGFDQPVAILHLGADLFVANSNDTVSEVAVAGGGAVRVLSSPKYGFSSPVALASASGNLLVLSSGRAPATNGTLTVINPSTGKRISKISDASFVGSVAMAVYGGRVLVANAGGNSVSDVDLSTATVTDVITDPGISSPGGIAVSKGYAWVSDSATNAATQIDLATDSALQTVSSGSYGFMDPSVAIATAGNVFIATPYGASPMVTKLSAKNGQPYWYMCNTNGPYYFSDLSAFAVDGSNLWVASSTGANNPNADAATGSLTELSTIDGSLLATLPAS